MSTVDDDSLEQAFITASASAPGPTVPQKRTREDIIRELKEKRGIKSNTLATAESKAKDDALEAAKKQGKFKPIGFKPIDKPKKKKAKADGADGERKKKKRKVEAADGGKSGVGNESSAPPPPPIVADASPTSFSSKPALPEDGLPEDFDIFAGAEEYEGIDLGDEDDEDDSAGGKKLDNTKPDLEDGWEPPTTEPPRPAAPGKWFAEEAESDPPSSSSRLPLPPVLDKHKSLSRPTDEDEEGEVEQPTRLVPLASSALPSIKDLLAMDKAANSSDKWKKRKDKKKAGKEEGDDTAATPKQKMSAEVKAERDYKRLVLYLFD